MTPNLRPGDKVRVVGKRFLDTGMPEGTIACVVRVRRDGLLELEIGGKDGFTLTQFSARADEVELVESEKYEGAGPRGPA